jgi:hypothetical protein
MAHINEVAPVIIDPRHERFGQVGEMTFSGHYGDGTCIIKFEDGEEIDFNDGWLTGITQFVALRKAESEKVDKLVTALPGLKDNLEFLFDRIVEPAKYPPTPETVSARAGTTALIDSVIVAAE